MKSMMGNARSIIVVDSFASVMIERIQMRKPYTVFPADPVIIF